MSDPTRPVSSDPSLDARGPHHHTPMTEGERRAIEIVEAAETGGRKLFGWQQHLVTIIAVGWCLFQMYAAWNGTMVPTTLRAIHLAFAFALAFLVFPFRKTPGQPQTRVPWSDWLLGAAATGSALYFVAQYANIAGNGGIRADVPLDLIAGSALVVLLLLTAWRTIGIAMPLISMAFILFAFMGAKGLIKGIQTPFHGGYTWPQLIGQLATNTEGIFGTALGVSAQIVFLFVLFGAVFDKMGAGDWFMRVAQGLLGRFRGGAAKASIVSSGLNGIISGSSVSNVVTGGNITIGTMIRTGYSREKAGAIEVASSSNGQLMPPVMGAAAFIMAQNLNIEYRSLILAAAIPAFLCYAALLVVAHIEALKLNLRGLPKSELPPVRRTLLEGWYYILPLGYLIGVLTSNPDANPERIALYTILIMVVMMLVQEVFWGRKDGRTPLRSFLDGGRKLIDAFEAGARSMVGIAVATAAAGIIVGIVTVTGLGFGLADVVEGVSALFANEFVRILVVLMMGQLIALILGMGLPTTANYILMSALIVPIIARIAGLDTSNPAEMLPVHMFVFYFGIMADSTPPVALAAFAAAAISGGDPVKTGVQAFKYELRTALLAYMMFFNPQLLLIANNRLGGLPLGEAIPMVLFAFIGLVAFSAGTLRFLHRRTNLVQTLLLLVASFILIIPTDIVWNLGALALIALVYFWQKAGRTGPPSPVTRAA
ncbi:TRAP transporter permease [Deinococcus deserti]|uniref:Putative TRAP transporter, permease component n=1 Tax=Deinococcus deserti (strain DSM 17065 / CIP 109153 / LMG 22923 / VCD115) TaxID=546414 RepID=C1D1A9_DEIDV|nr:TRAP transporter permease [Deinococcus deserti]ACO45633.1 putative TRAP transporter, permease component [Deinococcus deserti VCD115]